MLEGYTIQKTDKIPKYNKVLHEACSHTFHCITHNLSEEKQVSFYCSLNSTPISFNAYTRKHTQQPAYLAHSINADISLVIRARGAISNLAGHGEEEVKVLCNAV